MKDSRLQYVFKYSFMLFALSLVYVLLSYQIFSLRVELNVLIKQVHKKNVDYKSAHVLLQNKKSYKNIQHIQPKNKLISDYQNNYFLYYEKQ